MKIPVIIPAETELLVQKGQEVNFGTPFVRRNAVEIIKIPLASALGFSPDKIFIFLHKFVGDKVQRGELLAEKKAMMSSRQYLSEYDGTIKEINHYDGTVTLETPKEDTFEQNCFFKGTIEEIEGNVLLLKISHGKQYPLMEAAPFFGGEVVLYDSALGSQITEDEVNDHVIVADKLTSYDQTKLEALGAQGFVLLQNNDDPASVPTAMLKTVPEFEEIKKQGFSACMIGPDHTTIYFYD